MQILVAFFFKYLLAPIIVIIAAFVMNYVSKGQGVLKLKKLIIFILISSILVALPSLLGLLKYEFVWGGLLICLVIYLFLGFCFNLFSRTNWFKSIGTKGSTSILLLIYLIIGVLGSWMFYLVFTWLSSLNYGVLAMLSVLWFLIPPFYKLSRSRFIEIPTIFYKSWVVSKDPKDDEFWNTIDTFRLMQVTVKVKRTPEANTFSSFSVKVPDGVSLGRWFNRFIEDQNIRFPSTPIELTDGEGSFGWIFYTNKWFPFPLFTRMLDFDKDTKDNKIKSKTTIYIKRVSQEHIGE